MVTRVEVVPWSQENTVMKILEELLRRRGRTLTTVQWNYVREQVKLEPTALYVQLAVRVIGSWSSYELSTTLQGGVRNLINQIFDSTESTYGVVFTRAALGFMTFAVDGLSDNELMDLLTMHERVMSKEGINEFNESSRLPSHVWLRLRSEVFGLVMEREGGRLGWFHRQLKEAAEERYNDEKQYLHELMGTYFSGLISKQDQEEKGISWHTLTLNCPIEEIWSPNAMINRRRCVEACHHLLAVGRYDEAEKELCTIEAVYAAAKCGLYINVYIHIIINIHLIYLLNVFLIGQIFNMILNFNKLLKLLREKGCSISGNQSHMK